MASGIRNCFAPYRPNRLRAKTHLRPRRGSEKSGSLTYKADNDRCVLLSPASRLNVMMAIKAAAVPPLAVVQSDVASAVKLVALPARDFACRESPIAAPTKPTITQSRSAK